MRSLLFVPSYITWHYSRALKGIVSITANIVWFLWHFFSIGLLLRTFFTPWQRLQETHSKSLDIEGYLSTAIVNGVMRGVGMIIRFLFIVIGLLAIICTIASGLIVLTVWILLPAIIVYLFIFGLNLLFRAS